MSDTGTLCIKRRDLFKLSGVGLSGLLLQVPGQAVASAPAGSELAILYDASKCIGCRACERACKTHNGLPSPDEPNTELSAATWNLIVTRKGVDAEDHPFFSYQCMHCTDAACAAGCPSGALSVDDRGFVSFNQNICIGCGYCTQFCPFGIPHLGEVNLITGEAVAAKCTFCQDKIDAGTGGPSCAEACPTGALTWGERETLLTTARARVAELKAGGDSGALLYGEEEAGGLHRLSILLDQPSAYGLPADPGGQFDLARLYRKIVQPAGFAIFGVALVGVVAAFGLARRNIHMEEVE
ncbi:MAG: 4Fe-4S dicluster domain-containing protein [Anaerolineae bacterium]|nr:4Fe-4S dicluster domain-containing protein [Anaerolineae bacterium]